MISVKKLRTVINKTPRETLGSIFHFSQRTFVSSARVSGTKKMSKRMSSIFQHHFEKVVAHSFTMGKKWIGRHISAINNIQHSSLDKCKAFLQIIRNVAKHRIRPWNDRTNKRTICGVDQLRVTTTSTKIKNQIDPFTCFLYQKVTNEFNFRSHDKIQPRIFTSETVRKHMTSEFACIRNSSNVMFLLVMTFMI